jgi:aminoglycoside phosphotransferase (APT) family kinase protein
MAVFESLTKRAVDQDTLAALVRAAFGPRAALARSQELNEGFFNAAFRLTLADGREAVLKAAPAADVTLLSYERDIMRGEAEFFRLAREAADVPLPDVLYEGFDRTLIDGDFLVLSAVDGSTWHAREQELPDAARAALKRELGGIAARLHTVTHPAGRFGYPAVPELSGTDWPTAYLAMISAVLGDAVHFEAPLPLPAAELYAVAERHVDALAQITRPTLVHFDLWPGNVMITGGEDGGAPRISGLIDGERMIWGDPLMEFVGMEVFGRADLDEHIAAGYVGAGGEILADADAQRRLTLYHLYMQVLLLTEMGPRGYTDPGYLELFGAECPKRIREAAELLG